MLVFVPPSTPPIRDAIAAGRLGCIDTPAQRNTLPAVGELVLDNGCGPGKGGGPGRGWPGDDAYLRWLTSRRPLAERVRFAVAPDVVGDSAATLARFTRWGPLVREVGFRVALAAQDGLTPAGVPWADLDVVFVGGSTAWKLADDGAGRIVRSAAERGVPVHVGRVNSAKRYRRVLQLAATVPPEQLSCDGTFTVFGPDVNLPILLSWSELARQGDLFTG